MAVLPHKNHRKNATTSHRVQTVVVVHRRRLSPLSCCCKSQGRMLLLLACICMSLLSQANGSSKVMSSFTSSARRRLKGERLMVGGGTGAAGEEHGSSCTENGKNYTSTASSSTTSSATSNSCTEGSSLTENALSELRLEPTKQSSLSALLLLSSPSSPSPHTHTYSKTETDFCFSGHTTVQVWGKGQVPMSELKVGDIVVTGNELQRFQPVYAFGHYKTGANVSTEFLRITTFPHDRRRKPLEITGQHMLYLHNKTNPVRADSLKVGDVLRGDHYTGLTVTKIGKVKRRNNYAPLTPHGTILVDGILASSYISLQKEAKEHIELGQSGFEIRLSQRGIVHMALSPFRMYCMGLKRDGSGGCHNNYNEEGLPPYVALGLKLADWGNAQNIVVQLLALAAFFIVLGPFKMMEDAAGPEYGPLMFFLVVVSIILYKRSNYRVRIKIRHQQQQQQQQLR